MLACMRLCMYFGRAACGLVSVTRLVSRSVSPLVRQSVSRLVGQSVSPSVGQSVLQSVSWLVLNFLYRWPSRSLSHSLIYCIVPLLTHSLLSRFDSLASCALPCVSQACTPSEFLSGATTPLSPAFSQCVADSRGPLYVQATLWNQCMPTVSNCRSLTRSASLSSTLHTRFAP